MTSLQANYMPFFAVRDGTMAGVLSARYALHSSDPGGGPQLNEPSW